MTDSKLIKSYIEYLDKNLDQYDSFLIHAMDANVDFSSVEIDQIFFPQKLRKAVSEDSMSDMQLLQKKYQGFIEKMRQQGAEICERRLDIKIPVSKDFECEEVEFTNQSEEEYRNMYLLKVVLEKDKEVTVVTFLNDKYDIQGYSNTVSKYAKNDIEIFEGNFHSQYLVRTVYATEISLGDFSREHFSFLLLEPDSLINGINQKVQNRIHMLLGEPGAGKTFLLRMIARYFVKKRLYGGCLENEAQGQVSSYLKKNVIFEGDAQNGFPVFLKVRDFADRLQKEKKLFSIENEILKEIQKSISNKKKVGLSKEILNDIDVLLLDGLDEFYSAKEVKYFLRRINEFLNEHPQISVYVTCRKTDYHEIVAPLIKKGINLNHYEETDIIPLEPAESIAFAERWYQNAYRKNNKEYIEQEFIYPLKNNKNLLELISNPLELTSLLIVSSQNNYLPSDMNELYQESVALWLGWACSRDYSDDFVHYVLAYLAYDMTCRHLVQISEEELRLCLRKAEKELDFKYEITTSEDCPDTDAENRFLDFLTRSYIVQKKEANYEFVHRKFQDYLCANYILRDIAGMESEEEKYELFISHIEDEDEFFSGVLLFLYYAEKSLRRELRKLLFDCISKRESEYYLKLLLSLMSVFRFQEKEQREVFHFLLNTKEDENNPASMNCVNRALLIDSYEEELYEIIKKNDANSNEVLSEVLQEIRENKEKFYIRNAFLYVTGINKIIGQMLLKEDLTDKTVINLFLIVSEPEFKSITFEETVCKKFSEKNIKQILKKHFSVAIEFALQFHIDVIEFIWPMYHSLIANPYYDNLEYYAAALQYLESDKDELVFLGLKMIQEKKEDFQPEFIIEHLEKINDLMMNQFMTKMFQYHEQKKEENLNRMVLCVCEILEMGLWRIANYKTGFVNSRILDCFKFAYQLCEEHDFSPLYLRFLSLFPKTEKIAKWILEYEDLGICFPSEKFTRRLYEFEQEKRSNPHLIALEKAKLKSLANPAYNVEIPIAMFKLEKDYKDGYLLAKQTRETDWIEKHKKEVLVYLTKQGKAYKHMASLIMTEDEMIDFLQSKEEQFQTGYSIINRLSPDSPYEYDFQLELMQITNCNSVTEKENFYNQFIDTASEVNYKKYEIDYATLKDQFPEGFLIDLMKLVCNNILNKEHFFESVRCFLFLSEGHLLEEIEDILISWNIYEIVWMRLKHSQYLDIISVIFYLCFLALYPVNTRKMNQLTELISFTDIKIYRKALTIYFGNVWTSRILFRINYVQNYKKWNWNQEEEMLKLFLHTNAVVSKKTDMISYYNSIYQPMIRSDKEEPFLSESIINKENEFLESISFTNGILTLGKNITVIPDFAFANNKKIRKVIFERQVKKIGRYAFAGCSRLKEIEIPERIKAIEEGTFLDCIQLEQVCFSNHIEEIGAMAFCGCKSLREIDLPDSIIKIGERAFASCRNLSEVYLPSYLQELGAASFAGCIKIENIILPESIPVIRRGCFSGCTYLKYVILGKNLTNIESHAFENVTSLQKIFIPKSVTTIGKKAFMGCRDLQTLVCEGNLRCIKEKAFMKCENLHNIISKGMPASDSAHPVLYVSEIERQAFEGCNSLEQILLKWTTIIGESAFANCKGLKMVSIGTKQVENIKISPYVFSGCSELVTIMVSSLKCISKGLFENCKKLQEIKIQGVLEIEDRAFWRCSSIETVGFPELRFLGKSAFDGCISLENFTCHQNLQEIPERAFHGCTNLRNIGFYIDNEAELYLLKILGITKADKEDNQDNLENETNRLRVKKVGNSAFEKCKNLQQIIFSEEIEEIGERAFYSCKNLEEVKFDIQLTYTKFHDYQFYDYLGKHIVIASEVFKNCHKLHLSGSGMFYYEECNIELAKYAERIGVACNSTD